MLEEANVGTMAGNFEVNRMQAYGPKAKQADANYCQTSAPKPQQTLLGSCKDILQATVTQSELIDRLSDVLFGSSPESPKANEPMPSGAAILLDIAGRGSCENNKRLESILTRLGGS